MDSFALIFLLLEITYFVEPVDRVKWTYPERAKRERVVFGTETKMATGQSFDFCLQDLFSFSPS
jgi:hypothetical protein